MFAGWNPLDHIGGHSSYVRAHARAARMAGFEPHIFCVGTSNRVVQTEFGAVHVVRAPGKPFRQIFEPPLLARAVESFARGRPGPHLLHGFAHWGGVAVAVADHLRRSGIGASVVVNCYTTWQHEAAGVLRGIAGTGLVTTLRARARIRLIGWALEPYERRAYTRADVVITNYDSVTSILRRRYTGSAPVRRMAYAPEVAFLLPPEREPPTQTVIDDTDVPLVLSVSRHDPRKGLDVLLAALSILERDGVPFRACLIGPGPLLGRHRRLAAHLGLERTAIVGGVPDPGPFLAAARIFVLPSIEEGSGSVALLEAMHAGLAIVASRCDGVPEDITDGETGLLVEPGDAASLAAAIRRLIEDEALRERLGHRARIDARRRFSAEALAVAVQELYGSLGFHAQPVRGEVSGRAGMGAAKQIATATGTRRPAGEAPRAG